MSRPLAPSPSSCFSHVWKEGSPSLQAGLLPFLSLPHRRAVDSPTGPLALGPPPVGVRGSSSSVTQTQRLTLGSNVTAHDPPGPGHPSASPAMAWVLDEEQLSLSLEWGSRRHLLRGEQAQRLPLPPPQDGQGVTVGRSTSCRRPRVGLPTPSILGFRVTGRHPRPSDCSSRKAGARHPLPALGRPQGLGSRPGCRASAHSVSSGWCHQGFHRGPQEQEAGSPRTFGIPS